MLRFLYETVPGRFLLRILTRPGISAACGRLMDSRWSRPLIPLFIRRYRIDMTDYETGPGLFRGFDCFNAFFCRQIQPGLRPVCPDPDALTAPCDGLLSAYPIRDSLILPVKGSRYAVSDLLRSKQLARAYDGGICLVFRLCVQHYHRYCYPDDAFKSKNICIPGVLHTVRPAALRSVPVFTENTRTYTMLHTAHFGRVIQMEVGAMLVGRIRNYHEEAAVKKGMEKGLFMYGGSTVILLIEPGRVRVPKQLLEATAAGREVRVKMGQKIGVKPG